MPRADGLVPIPPFYAVYVLRSTVARTSFYVGSTPNPPRRLRQHNGEIRGGARRTSRKGRQPWEMIALVSGFPGTVAALRFEWALSHPHLTTHIPPEQRVVKRVTGTRSKRPYTLPSLAATVHLLLRAPAFSRWPLKVHLFARDLHDTWQRHVALLPAEDQLRDEIAVLADFGPPEKNAPISGSATTSPTPAPAPAPAPAAAPPPPPPWGIHVLPVDYEHMREYIAKTHSVFAFERQGRCVFCTRAMPPDEGLYAVCPNDGCESVGHLTCWSKHVLGGERKRGSAMVHLIPVRGECPSCRNEVRWEAMMKEMTLRLRGPKQVDALLNPRTKRKPRHQEEDDGDDDEK